MSTQRKEQQQLIIQCFRLMLASGVVRTADLDPESLPRHWSSPLPTPQRKQPERQQAGTWFRRAFVGMAAFLMLSLLTLPGRKPCA